MRTLPGGHLPTSYEESSRQEMTRPPPRSRMPSLRTWERMGASGFSRPVCGILVWQPGLMADAAGTVFIVPVSRMRERRHRELKSLAPGHTVSSRASPGPGSRAESLPLLLQGRCLCCARLCFVLNVPTKSHRLWELVY